MEKLPGLLFKSVFQRRVNKVSQARVNDRLFIVEHMLHIYYGYLLLGVAVYVTASGASPAEVAERGDSSALGVAYKCTDTKAIAIPYECVPVKVGARFFVQTVGAYKIYRS